MFDYDNAVLSLVDYLKIDAYSIECHFRCKETDKEVVSEVAFEPYDGAIVITYKDILLHPFDSYKRYYHTPITIYSHENHETIVKKAFEKVADYFEYNSEKQQYVCKH